MYEVVKEKNLIIFKDLETNKQSSLDLNTGQFYGILNSPLKKPNPLIKQAITYYLKKVNDFRNPIRIILEPIRNGLDSKYLPTIEKYAIFGISLCFYQIDEFSQIPPTKEFIDYLKEINTSVLYVEDYKNFLFKKKTEGLNIPNQAIFEKLGEVYRFTQDINYIKYLLGRIYCRKIDKMLGWERKAMDLYNMKKKLNKIGYYENDFYFDYCNSIEQIEIEEAKKQNKKLSLATSKFSEYSNNDFIIKPLSTVNDFIEEAAQQNNCVESYLQKVIDENCYIFSLRKKTNIKNSYITIEIINSYSQYYLGQVLKRGNRNIDKEDISARIFIEEWFKTL